MVILHAWPSINFNILILQATIREQTIKHKIEAVNHNLCDAWFFWEIGGDATIMFQKLNLSQMDRNAKSHYTRWHKEKNRERARHWIKYWFNI